MKNQHFIKNQKNLLKNAKKSLHLIKKGFIMRLSTTKGTTNQIERHTTMNNIINLNEYNIDPSTIAGFLNERLHSDCHSFMIYNVSGKKAMAVSVEREFKPEWAGAYHCTNNIEQHRAPIVITGEPFEVELNRGNWGKWCYDFIGVLLPVADGYKPGDMVNGKLVVGWGDSYVRFARLLPSGKPARKFHKYSQIEEHCGQFHDYNF